MSLIVSVVTREGVVMASDSRTTLSKPIEVDGKSVANQMIELSDSTYKTFDFSNNIGISTCGCASVCGQAISSHLENIRIKYNDAAYTVECVANLIINYFEKLGNFPEIIFHIAGYEVRENKKVLVVKRIGVGGGKRYSKDFQMLGVMWDGETAIMNRIMKAGYMVGRANAMRLDSITINKVENGSSVASVLKDRIIIPGYSPWHDDLNVEWQFFSLQDGIDFAIYAIRTTIDTMRFQSVPKTVGGPVDLLVVAPTGVKWISHKDLHI